MSRGFRTCRSSTPSIVQPSKPGVPANGSQARFALHDAFPQQAANEARDMVKSRNKKTSMLAAEPHVRLPRTRLLHEPIDHTTSTTTLWNKTPGATLSAFNCCRRSFARAHFIDINVNQQAIPKTLKEVEKESLFAIEKPEP